MDLVNSSVRDLVTEAGGWNWELLDWLLVSAKMKITVVLPPKAKNGDDELVFSTNEEGNFSINRMYKDLDHSDTVVDSKEWSKVWDLKVPERVRYFVWILKHDRLLTNHQISISDFSIDGCRLCGAASETSMHVL